MSILASLARAYERISDAPKLGYSSEKIGVVIGLTENGTVATVSPRGEATSRKKIAPSLLVPQPNKKSVNISPNFLWGNTAYVLGVTARDDKKPKRLADEHTAFVQYHLDVLKNTDDSGLKALRHFLRTWKPDQFVEPTWHQDIKDQNVVFALESERRHNLYLHDRPAAKAIWAELRAADERLKSVCLVTGTQAPIARLHPSIKGVWGAQSSGASIVAFNHESFESYGHEQGNNAPVSSKRSHSTIRLLSTASLVGTVETAFRSAMLRPYFGLMPRKRLWPKWRRARLPRCSQTSMSPRKRTKFVMFSNAYAMASFCVISRRS